MTATPARPAVQSVDRALDIVETLARHDGVVGVTELAREVGLPQGTTHRLLSSLAARGWVRRDPHGRYALGPATLRLGDAGLRELAAGAAPVLREVVAATGETANLAMLEGADMVYVAQSPSPHTLRIFAEVGRRVPLHSTAVGKVALAALPDAEVRHALAGRPLEASTPHTLTTVEDVVAAVAAARETGWALDDEERELGVRCVAVPVPLDGAGLALSVSGPTERMTVAHARSVVPALQRLAAELAARQEGGR